MALLLGMAHVIVRENLLDHEFIAARTSNVEAYIEHVKQFPPEWAAQITGVPAKDIEAAALMYGRADKAAIYYTLGITEHICGVDNVQSLDKFLAGPQAMVPGTAMPISLADPKDRADVVSFLATAKK